MLQRYAGALGYAYPTGHLCPLRAAAPRMLVEAEVQEPTWQAQTAGKLRDQTEFWSVLDAGQS